jgi:hypothetical protein
MIKDTDPKKDYAEISELIGLLTKGSLKVENLSCLGSQYVRDKPWRKRQKRCEV